MEIFSSNFQEILSETWSFILISIYIILFINFDFLDKRPLLSDLGSNILSYTRITKVCLAVQ